MSRSGEWSRSNLILISTAILCYASLFTTSNDTNTAFLSKYIGFSPFAIVRFEEWFWGFGEHACKSGKYSFVTEKLKLLYSQIPGQLFPASQFDWWVGPFLPCSWEKIPSKFHLEHSSEVETNNDSQKQKLSCLPKNNNPIMEDFAELSSWTFAQLLLLFPFRQPHTRTEWMCVTQHEDWRGTKREGNGRRTTIWSHKDWKSQRDNGKGAPWQRGTRHRNTQPMRCFWTRTSHKLYYEAMNIGEKQFWVQLS